MFTNGYITEILDILYFISVSFGLLTIIIKNPVISVLFLIGLFISVALYLVLMGISFIGLAYLLVYVGAVSILFIFILMLINVRVSELSNETNNSIPLAIIVSLAFNSYMYKLLPLDLINSKGFKSEKYWEYINSDYTNTYINNSKTKDIIQYVTASSWDNKLTEIDHISGIGNILYTSYSIWLILTSLILLLAMVGAIIITIRRQD